MINVSNVSANENKEAIREYQALGRPRALRNMIALNNKNLIGYAIKKYRSWLANRDIEEIEQEAFILLLEAIDKYNPERGAFSSFYLMYFMNITRNTKEYKDLSLDSPLSSSDDEDITLVDTIEDLRASNSFIDVDKKDFDINIRATIEKALEKDISDLIFSRYGICTKKTRVIDIAKKYNRSTDWVYDNIRKAERQLFLDKNMMYLWLEYNGYDSMNTSSIIVYGSNTNRVNDPVLNAVIKRQEIIEGMINRKRLQR